jgi:hypothetical protein
MSYVIPKGTSGKLIEIPKNQDVKVSDWTTRKELRFDQCILHPASFDHTCSNTTLASSLVEQGYVLFGGEVGNDREARYILAVHQKQVR